MFSYDLFTDKSLRCGNWVNIDITERLSAEGCNRDCATRVVAVCWNKLGVVVTGGAVE
jgi:hypothetical protein